MDSLRTYNAILEDFIDNLENDEVIQGNVRVEDKTFSHNLIFLVSFRRRVDAESMCLKMKRMCNIIRSMIERCSAIGDYNAQIRTIDPEIESPKQWPQFSKKPLLKKDIESVDAAEPLKQLIDMMSQKKLSGSIMFDVNIAFDYSFSNISNRSAFDLIKLISDIYNFICRFCNGFSQQRISQAAYFDDTRIHINLDNVDSKMSDDGLMEKITGRRESAEYFSMMLNAIKNRKMGQIDIPGWLMREITDAVPKFKDHIENWVRIGAQVEVSDEDKTVTCYARNEIVHAVYVQWAIYCLNEWSKHSGKNYRVRIVIPGTLPFNQKLKWLERNYDKIESVGKLLLIGTPFHDIEREMLPKVQVDKIEMNPLVLAASIKNKETQKVQIFPQTWVNSNIEITAPGWTLSKEEDSIRVFLVAKKEK